MMVANKSRSGGRAKFNTPEGIRAAMHEALGTKPEGGGEVIEATVADTEETGPNQSTALEVTITPTTAIDRPSVTQNACVRALEKSIGFSKNAFVLEAAVNLAIFASSSTGADLPTKRRVMEVYMQAGYDVSPVGKDYKTVNRRINVFKDLFNLVGQNAVLGAMSGHRDGKALESLCGHMSEQYKFDSINAVLEYVGKPAEQTNTPEVRAARAEKEAAENRAQAASIGERMEQRRAERQMQLVEESDGIIVSAGVLSIVIPRDITPAEVRAMSTKLSEFADRLEAEIGTPEEQHNRELHS